MRPGDDQNGKAIAGLNVVPTVGRSQSSTWYKLCISEGAGPWTKPGEISVLLSREQLGSSPGRHCRHTRNRGQLKTPSPRER